MSRLPDGNKRFLDRLSDNSNSIYWYGFNLLTLFSSSSQLNSWEISQSLKSLEKLAKRIENLNGLDLENEDSRINYAYAVKLAQLRSKLSQTKGLQLNLTNLKGSWANSQLTEAGNCSINLSYEGLRLLTILNAICLDIINQGNSQGTSPSLEEKFGKVAEALLYSFILFFDHEGIIGHCHQTIALEKNGLLSTFGLSQEDDIFEAPLLMTFDHQIEYIVLHELGHFFHAHFDASVGSAQNQSSEKKELDADMFAILTARNIWKSTDTFHTAYCEFFQLVLFLYFDLYDFLLNAISRASRLAIPDYLRGEIPESETTYAHPISASRFLNAILYLPSISATSQFFLSAVEHAFEKFKDDIILGKIDLSPIVQLSRVNAQRVMNRWGHFEKDLSMDELFVHAFTSGDYHLDGKILDPNIWIRANNFERVEEESALKSLLNRERNTFSNNVVSLFGSLETERLVNEASRLFRI